MATTNAGAGSGPASPSGEAGRDDRGDRRDQDGPGSDGREVAVVTGGAGALGAALVARLSSSGIRVFVPTHRTVKETPVVDGGPVYLEADLTSADAVEAFFAEVDRRAGRLDALHNVAGGYAGGALATTDAATFRDLVERNATTTFLACRAAAPRMARGGGGRIVNVASVAALGRDAGGKSAYTAAKAAVIGLTVSLAQELGPVGITVNAVVPTVLDTASNRRDMPRANHATWLPVDEVAGVMAFLGSNAARLVTGNAVVLERKLA